jgi:hypothetical protein
MLTILCDIVQKYATLAQMNVQSTKQNIAKIVQKPVENVPKSVVIT